MSPRSRWRWRRPADATGSSTGPKMPPRSPPRHKPAYFACTVPYAKRAIVASAAGLLIRHRSSTRALGLAFTFRADKTQDAHPASVKAALARRRLELRAAMHGIRDRLQMPHSSRLLAGVLPCLLATAAGGSRF